MKQSESIMDTKIITVTQENAKVPVAQKKRRFFDQNFGKTLT